MCQLCNILEKDLNSSVKSMKKINGNTFYFVTKNNCICTASASCLIQEITSLRDEGEAKIQSMVALGDTVLRNEKNKNPEVQQTISELQKKWENLCQLATEYSR